MMAHVNNGNMQSDSRYVVNVRNTGDMLTWATTSPDVEQESF